MSEIKNDPANRTDITLIRRLAHEMREGIESIPRDKLPIGMANFPRGACGDASMLLGAYLTDNGVEGFEYVKGSRGDPSDNSWTAHSWLSCGPLVLDITADQFADAPSKVIVTAPSVWHQQFEIDDENEPSDFRVWHGGGIPELHALYSRLKPALFDNHKNMRNGD